MSAAQKSLEPRGCRVVAKNLTRSFGKNIALDALNLEIAPGQTLGLLGANGAGKTTFIRLVTGYLLPTAGEVRIDAYSPTTHAKEVHARIGYAAETSQLYADLRVRSFLRFAGAIRGIARAALETRIDEVVTQFQITDVQKRLIGHLSKGYKQRVALAQAFLHNPELLIVDEPTSGLDPAQQEEVCSLLHASKGERTVILCTHNLNEVRMLADRIAVLRRGRLVAEGTPESVLQHESASGLFRGQTPTEVAKFSAAPTRNETSTLHSGRPEENA